MPIPTPSFSQKSSRKYKDLLKLNQQFKRFLENKKKVLKLYKQLKVFLKIKKNFETI